MGLFEHPLLKSPGMLLKKAGMLLPVSVSKENHIFVVGAPRSGTALLESLLLAHPSLGGFGFETAFFMLHDFANFPDLIADEKNKKLLRETKDIVEFYDKLTQELKPKDFKGRWVEKTPQHLLRIRFLLKHFPAAHFLHIYRDGRDCFCSARKQTVIRKLQARNTATYARYWKKCIRARLNAGPCPNLFDVRYEELVADPAKCLTQVMAFLNESFAEEQLDNFRREVKDNPRLLQPISQDSIGNYKKEMTETEIRIFNSIAGNELKVLGYDLD